LLKNQTIRLFERPLKQTNILLIPNRPNASWPCTPVRCHSDTGRAD
jgi:hypothetical protein